jgi:hypothetical protein
VRQATRKTKHFRYRVSGTPSKTGGRPGAAALEELHSTARVVRGVEDELSSMASAMW